MARVSTSTASGDATSTSTSTASPTRSARPVLRSSTTTTFSPRSCRRRTTCAPMYPAPPVTRIVMAPP
ncbi:Uncharacterised protein [Mycobacteroides abscessus]|nr:Uncharacterised protein [Mycobacteroides abscessus]